MTVFQSHSSSLLTFSILKNEFFVISNCSKMNILKTSFCSFGVSTCSKMNIFERQILRFSKSFLGIGAKHQQVGLGGSRLRSKKWISIVHACIHIFQHNFRLKTQIVIPRYTNLSRDLNIKKGDNCKWIIKR